ncbi:MAG: crossover junction endodeoxyribonuclease RuvC [Mariprofundaceae bacterium]|nr:crossover junction endodeoxyribonuclease RuvC [Mariprofundaceae bacterium]
MDPGSRKTGYGIVDVDGNRITHVTHGIIKVGDGDFTARLGLLFSDLSSLIEEFSPDCAAMEDVFVSRNVSSALKLGQARGALIAACTHAGLDVTAYSPTSVKQAVVGFGRAEKEQVQHMIKMLLKPPSPLQEDAADALGVAVCHANHAGSSKRLAESVQKDNLLRKDNQRRLA